MAISSSTTAAALYYISPRRRHFASAAPRSCSSSSPFSVSITSLPAANPLKFAVRSTDGASEETTVTATQTEVEAESESPIELPKGPPSVISSLNVERALRGIPITDVDYYGNLGIQKGCSNDQVYAAYKNKVEEFTNKGLDEEELNKKLELLKESYSVLSNPQERRMYDWCIARSANPDNYLWPYEVDDTKNHQSQFQRKIIEFLLECRQTSTPREHSTRCSRLFSKKTL